jgi:hypothetical protein
MVLAGKILLSIFFTAVFATAGSALEKKCDDLYARLSPAKIQREFAFTGNTFAATSANVRRLRNYSGRNLPALQDKSLRQSLIDRGARDLKFGGYGSLAQISKENVKRWAGPEVYIPSKGMEEVENLVSNLDFRLVHNSRSFREKGKVPIMSSRRLEEMGLGGGANTNPFNKDLLKTDDNVFFFLFPYIKGHTTNLPSISEYGKYGFEAEPSYARQAGWVSPFVMGGEDFLDELSLINKGLVARLKHGGAFDDFVDSDMDFNTPIGRLSRQAVQEQSKMDFTLDDFREMVKNALLIQLSKLKDENPKEFTRAIDNLKSKSPEDVMKVFRAYGTIPIGLGGRFEFKVPVAVPQEHIIPLQRISK